MLLSFIYLNFGTNNTLHPLYRAYMDEHRVDRVMNRTSISESLWFHSLIDSILMLMNRDVRLSGDTKGELWKYLFAFELFQIAKEGYGMPRNYPKSLLYPLPKTPLDFVQYLVFQQFYFNHKLYLFQETVIYFCKRIQFF